MNNLSEKRKLKILHITPMYPSPERPAFGIFVKSQIDSLRKYVDIDVLVLPGRNGILPYIKSIPRIFSSLWRRYDIVHVHYGHAGSLVKMLNLPRKFIITSYCGADLLGDIKSDGSKDIKGHFFKWINRTLSRFDKLSLVKSGEMAEQIMGVAAQIEIIPNGVDIEQFRPMDKQASRKKLGIDPHKKVILFPADSRNANKNFQLLKKALDTCDLSNCEPIIFEGKKVRSEQMPDYFNAADLVCWTSLSEGSPNTIKEAMACNCSVFTTPCGDVNWLLEGVKGSKVLPFDQNVWNMEIKAFLESEGNLQTQSNARAVLIKKELDMESVAKRIALVYQRIVKNGEITKAATPIEIIKNRNL